MTRIKGDERESSCVQDNYLIKYALLMKTLITNKREKIISASLTSALSKMSEYIVVWLLRFLFVSDKNNSKTDGRRQDK